MPQMCGAPGKTVLERGLQKVINYINKGGSDDVKGSCWRGVLFLLLLLLVNEEDDWEVVKVRV